MNARRSEIIQLVNQRQRVSVCELSEYTSVSEVTIRQDLNYLEKQGYIKRVHGAAVAVNHKELLSENEGGFSIKKRMAEYAATLVGPQETVLIEGGSVNMLLARILAERGDVAIITNSASVAHSLRHLSAMVILLGGVYQGQTENLVGPMAKICIEQVHFSMAFLEVDGFALDTGFTCRDMMRADIVATILNKCKRNILLMEPGKFGLIYSTSVSQGINQFQQVISSGDISTEERQYFQQNGIDLKVI